MSDLTPQQRAQLDSNIKAMLSKGASQDDVIKYSNDFKLKYDPSVKKKEVGLQSGRELLTQYAPKSDNTLVQKQGQNKVEENLSYIADKPKRVQEFKQKVLKAQETAQPEKEPFNPEEYLKQDIDTDGADVLKQISAAKKFVGEAGVDELTSGALDLKAYLGVRKNQLDEKETELQNQIKNLQNKPSGGDIKANRPIDPQGISKEETPQDEQDIYNQISAVKEKRDKLTQAASYFAKKYAYKLKPNASNRELAKLHGDLMNDPNAEQIKRLEEKGIPIRDEDKLNEDVTGLEIRKDALEEKYSGVEKDDNYFDELYSIEQGQKDAIHKYPELKKKLVAALVVQKLGSKGAEYLVAQASDGDEEALKMLAEKVGRPVKDLRFLETGDLPTEGFMSNMFKAVYNAGTGLVTGAHRLVGDALGEDPDRISYINRQISGSGDEIFGNSPTEQTEQPQTILNEDLETVRNPNAGKYNYNLNSVSNLAGSSIGNLVGFIGGTKGLSALGMGERAALYSNIILGGHEQRYERAGEILGKGATEDQKNALALLNGTMEAAVFELIPNSAKQKLGISSIDKTAEKELAQLVKAGSIKNVDKEVLKSTVQKAIEGMGKSLGEAAKITLATKAGQLSSAIVNSIVGDKESENIGFDEFAHGLQPHKIAEELIGLALPLSLMEIPHTARNSRQFKETLFESGLSPNESKATLGKLVDEGKMSEEDAEKRSKVIDVMANIQKTMPDTNPTSGEKLTHKQQVEYTYNRVKELANQAKKEGVKEDAALSQFYDKNAKELVDERKAIIEGKHDEYLATSELFDRIKEKGTKDKTLDAGTKTAGVEYYTEQALTAPNSVKNQLGGDAELTTDLIARNTPFDIKAEIKDLKTKHKKLVDAEKYRDADELDKHINLLQEGLEKTKAPKEEIATGEVKPEPPKEPELTTEQKVKELETERDSEVLKLSKPEITSLKGLSDTEISKFKDAKDSERAIEILKEGGERDLLKQLIDCLWG
jgi:DNA-binding FrmR family transcriptional regulator